MSDSVQGAALSTEEFHRELVNAQAYLGRIAIRLTRNPEQAENLVQDALQKILEKQDKYVPGNFNAWAGTILKNIFINKYRRNREFTVEDPAAVFNQIAQSGNQIDHLVLDDLKEALRRMPEAKRSVILSALLGHSYDDMAEAHGIFSGTVKSRLSRGRAELWAWLEGEVDLDGEAVFVPPPAEEEDSAEKQGPLIEMLQPAKRHALWQWLERAPVLAVRRGGVTGGYVVRADLFDRASPERPSSALPRLDAQPRWGQISGNGAALFSGTLTEQRMVWLSPEAKHALLGPDEAPPVKRPRPVRISVAPAALVEGAAAVQSVIDAPPAKLKAPRAVKPARKREVNPVRAERKRATGPQEDGSVPFTILNNNRRGLWEKLPEDAGLRVRRDDRLAGYVVKASLFDGRGGGVSSALPWLGTYKNCGLPIAGGAARFAVRGVLEPMIWLTPDRYEDLMSGDKRPPESVPTPPVSVLPVVPVVRNKAVRETGAKTLLGKVQKGKVQESQKGQKDMAKKRDQSLIEHPYTTLLQRRADLMKVVENPKKTIRLTRWGGEIVGYLVSGSVYDALKPAELSYQLPTLKKPEHLTRNIFGHQALQFTSRHRDGILVFVYPDAARALMPDRIGPDGVPQQTVAGAGVVDSAPPLEQILQGGVLQRQEDGTFACASTQLVFDVTGARQVSQPLRMGLALFLKRPQDALGMLSQGGHDGLILTAPDKTTLTLAWVRDVKKPDIQAAGTEQTVSAAPASDLLLSDADLSCYLLDAFNGARQGGKPVIFSADGGRVTVAFRPDGTTPYAVSEGDLGRRLLRAFEDAQQTERPVVIAAKGGQATVVFRPLP